MRVAHIGAGARRIVGAGGLSLEEAARQVRFLKRRGMTAWVEDDGGSFVPVKGASRKPVWRE